MTPDELYEKGYTLEVAAWGVSVYRTDDGSSAASFAGIEGVTNIHFDRPHTEAEAAQRGWEAAQVDFVKRRLTNA